MTKRPDLRDQPAYPLSEVARYLRLPAATLRTWVVGRSYPTLSGPRQYQPLIALPATGLGMMSFNNLVEAHVLRAFRTEHGVPVKAVREALCVAAEQYGVSRLLLSKELSSNAGELFLDRYGELVHLTRSGQMAMRAVFEVHLRRVVWEADEFPIRLFPFFRSESSDETPRIAIDPSIEFGRPVLLSRSISTRVIIERLDAGESEDDIRADYGITEGEVRDAILYERAA